jgi:hypothetical protein
MNAEHLQELEEANRRAHEAFIAAIRTQRDTINPSRRAKAAYRRLCEADRRYRAALDEYGAQGDEA